MIQEFAVEYSDIITDLSTVGIVAMDRRMNIVLWNRFMSIHSRLKAEEVLGKSLFECFPELPRTWLEKKLKSIMVLKNASFSSWRQRPHLFRFDNTQSITSDISSMYQDCSFIAIKDKHGMIQGVCIAVHDVTETAGAHMLLQEATDQAILFEETSQRDGLTGLYNRSYFDEYFSNELYRTKRYGKPLSLLILDIDFFKKVNDEYGHPAGDEVLRVVSRNLLKTLRASDILCRYGGEEFALIFPEMNVKAGMHVAERLRGIIEKDVINFEDQQIKVTISMGISEYRDGVTPGQIIQEADTALYSSKENGRNRVTCYSAELESCAKPQ